MWVGSDAYAGFLTVFALGGYGYILSMINVHSHLVTGINPTNLGTIIAWAEAIANLGISIVLVRPFGIGGVALGTFLGALLTEVWTAPLYIYRLTGGKVKFEFRPVLRHLFFTLIPCLISSIVVYFCCQNILLKVFINLVICGVYCVLSWRSISLELRKIIIEILARCKIKNLCAYLSNR